MRRLLRLSLLLLLGLSLPSAKGAGYPEGRTAFRSYGVEKGLGNLSVMVLLQDREGYLWAGTEDGLYRYDGRDFQRFDRRQGLPSTYVGALHETADGVFWAGTYAGLARRGPGGFEAIPREAGLPPEQVETLTSTPDGRLWVGLRSGLFVHHAGSPFLPAPGWPSGEATALAVEPGGRLWAAVLRGGTGGLAQVLSLEGDTWRPWTLPGLGKERVDALARDGQGRIWVRTAMGLWALEPGPGQAFRSIAAPGSLVATPGHLCVDRKGRLMVPTGTGLFIRSGEGWQRLGPREGLPVDWARIALEDREGSLWIGSTGLHRQLGGGVWRGYGARDGLLSDVARALHQDRSGQLWVGTEKGIARAHASGFQALPGTTSNTVRSIQEGPDGLLYLAGLPIEVLRANPRTGRVERFGEEAGLVRGKRIFRLVLDREGVLWVATDGGGLMAAQTGPGPLRFTSVPLPGGDGTEYVSGLALDRQGRLWASGEKGLAVREKGIWRRFTLNDGLKQTHVAYLLPLRNGEFVAAYFEATGLSRLRYENGRLQVSELTGSTSALNAQKVYMLGEDRKGRLWVGTGQGVFLLDGAQETRFGADDGLVGEDINNMAFLEDHEGNIWIGTLAGLARFDPRTEPPSPPPPATVLLVTTLGKQTWNGLPPDNLRLSHRENLLEVRYAGLSFLRETAVQSETRLVGLEPEWRPTRSRELRIPALPHGTYRFEVRSRIGEGPWGPAAGFTFIIAPAWWQTWWFRTFAVLGLGGLGALAFWLRVRSLHHRTALLESQVAERTRELQAANEALRTQSLTDPLTGLRNRRFLGVCMPEDVAQVNRTHRNITLGKGERNALNIDLVFLMVDVDHFKAVNDQYGHHAGDEVLQQLAEILRSATRDSDTVVRWGGEEFLVVARNACRKDCSVLAERVRSLVEAHEFRLEDGQSLRRTCSVGFAFYPLVETPPDHVPWEQVVDVADHALYAAKRGGRNAWVGVFPRLELKAGEMPRNPGRELSALIEAGKLEVVTSLPAATPLDWEPPRS